MAKGMYATVGSTTKKIKKNYAVVDGTTRKVLKMYAVVDGKTREIWSSNAIEYMYNGAVLMLCNNDDGDNNKYLQPDNVYLTSYELSGTTFSSRKSSISANVFMDANVSANGKMTGYRTSSGLKVVPYNASEQSISIGSLASVAGVSLSPLYINKTFIRFNQSATHCVVVFPTGYYQYLTGIICSVGDDGTLTYVSTAFSYGYSNYFSYDSNSCRFDASDDLETFVVTGGYSGNSTSATAIFVNKGDYVYEKVYEKTANIHDFNRQGCGISRDGKYAIVPSCDATYAYSAWTLVYIDNGAATVITDTFINAYSTRYLVHKINQTRDGNNLFIPVGLHDSNYASYGCRRWSVKVSGASYTFLGEVTHLGSTSPGIYSDFSEDDKYMLSEKSIWEITRNASTGNVESYSQVSSITDSVDTDKTNYICGYSRFINPTLK